MIKVRGVGKGELTMKKIFCAVLVVCSLIGMEAFAQAQEPRNRDRHEGYYYPTIKSRENYVSRAQALPDSDRQRRLNFVSLLAQQQAERPCPPRYAMFAKGEEAEGHPDRLRRRRCPRIYRARALFVAVTNLSASGAAVPGAAGRRSVHAYFDLLKLLGFSSSSAAAIKFTHQVTLK